VIAVRGVVLVRESGAGVLRLRVAALGRRKQLRGLYAGAAGLEGWGLFTVVKEGRFAVQTVVAALLTQAIEAGAGARRGGRDVCETGTCIVGHVARVEGVGERLATVAPFLASTMLAFLSGLCFGVLLVRVS
jgi:hypothetical protein